MRKAEKRTDRQRGRSEVDKAAVVEESKQSIAREVEKTESTTLLNDASRRADVALGLAVEYVEIMKKIPADWSVTPMEIRLARAAVLVALHDIGKAELKAREGKKGGK